MFECPVSTLRWLAQVFECPVSTLRWLAQASSVSKIMAWVSLRLALAFMAFPGLGVAVAVPPGFAAIIQCALDWPGHVLLTYIEGPWSPTLLAIRLSIDVPLQYAFLARLGVDNAGPRALASQLLAVTVHWFAIRGLLSSRI